jgi:hypothetical protein
MHRNGMQFQPNRATAEATERAAHSDFRIAVFFARIEYPKYSTIKVFLWLLSIPRR